MIRARIANHEYVLTGSDRVNCWPQLLLRLNRELEPLCSGNECDACVGWKGMGDGGLLAYDGACCRVL